MRRPPRANPQRSVLDLDFDTVARLGDDPRWKSLQAVVDGKADARLGRRIGVTDRRLRKRSLQAVEHGLVGDLAR